MKISPVGAGVGALVGCVGRSAVVLLNMPAGAVGEPMLALPSAGIGLLVGAIAGAFGRPVLGAGVGAVLSGVVFELFMFACASLIGSISQRASSMFLSETLVYGLEMAAAGALAGGIGGLVGRASDTATRLSSSRAAPLKVREEAQAKFGEEKPPAQGADASERIHREEKQQ
jgi:hypothetical protein